MGNQDGRHAPASGQFDDQVHHRFLRGDVEAGGRLVRDQKLRIAGQRQRDYHALAHAARQFERIGVIAFAGTGDLDRLQCLDCLFAAIADHRLLHMLAQHVLDLVADLADRIERRARILEDHRDLAAAQVAHLARSVAVFTIDAGEHHRTFGNLARRDRGSASPHRRSPICRSRIHRRCRASRPWPRQYRPAAPPCTMPRRVANSTVRSLNVEQRLQRSSFYLTSFAAGRRYRAGHRRAG